MYTTVNRKNIDKEVMASKNEIPWNHLRGRCRSHSKICWLKLWLTPKRCESSLVIRGMWVRKRKAKDNVARPATMPSDETKIAAYNKPIKYS